MEYRWKVLIVAWFVNLSIWTGDIVLAVLGAPISRDFGLDRTYFSFILSLPILMMVILGVPVGVLIAKIGPKRTALIGLLVTLLAQVLRSVSSSTLQFTLFTALYGVGMAVVFPNLPKIAELSFPKEQQGLAAGIYMSGLPSGAIMGLVASSLLLPRISWSAILQLYALFLVIGAILWLLTAKDMPEGKVSMLEGLKKVSRNKFLWVVSVANLTLLVTYFGATKYFPSQEQLKEYLGSSAPFLIALISVALIFGLLLLPTLSLRIGEKKALILYQILVALLLPVFAWATIARSEVIWLLSPLIGVLLGGIIPLYFSFLSKTGVERKYFGIASGIFVSVLNIGGFLAPILSEIMDSMGGIYAVALLFSLSSIAGALLSYLFPTGKGGEEKS